MSDTDTVVVTDLDQIFRIRRANLEKLLKDYDGDVYALAKRVEVPGTYLATCRGEGKLQENYARRIEKALKLSTGYLDRPTGRETQKRIPTPPGLAAPKGPPPKASTPLSLPLASIRRGIQRAHQASEAANRHRKKRQAAVDPELKKLRASNLDLVMTHLQATSVPFGAGVGVAGVTISQARNGRGFFSDNLARRIEAYLEQPTGWLDRTLTEDDMRALQSPARTRGAVRTDRARADGDGAVPPVPVAATPAISDPADTIPIDDGIPLPKGRNTRWDFPFERLVWPGQSFFIECPPDVKISSLCSTLSSAASKYHREHPDVHLQTAKRGPKEEDGRLGVRCWRIK